MSAATQGLVVSATDPIRSFLSAAVASSDLSSELRDLASALSSEQAVPYRSIRAIWCADSSPGRPPLRQLMRGAQFVLSSPKPREKSDELKARLDKLREMQERREYAELVKDVVPKKEDNPEPFSSYKDQIGFGDSCYTYNKMMAYNRVMGVVGHFNCPWPAYIYAVCIFGITLGLHVVVIMFTGYLVGFYAFRALFSNSPVMNACGGILGVVGGMLMETVLFIIRTSSKELTSSAPRSKKLQ